MSDFFVFYNSGKTQKKKLNWASKVLLYINMTNNTQFTLLPLCKKGNPDKSRLSLTRNRIAPSVRKSRSTHTGCRFSLIPLTGKNVVPSVGEAEKSSAVVSRPTPAGLRYLQQVKKAFASRFVAASNRNPLPDVGVAAMATAEKSRHVPLPNVGFGFEHMVKYGWSIGKGLGAKKSGRLFPIDAGAGAKRRENGALLDNNYFRHGLGHKKQRRGNKPTKERYN